MSDRFKLKSDYCYSLFRFYEDAEIQSIVHHFKYQGMKKLSYFMGCHEGSNIIKNISGLNISETDIITPITLFKTKFRERGYNQSEYLARGINTVLNLNYYPDLLIRIKNTRTQTQLNLEERKENLKNAFILNEKFKHALINKNIIIIDDVVTSGSTLNEAIKVLKIGRAHV